MARHNEYLPYNDLIAGVSKLLKKSGRFCVIIPEELTRDFIYEAEFNQMYCTKLLNIQHKINSPVKRRLIEFQKNNKKTHESELIIEKSNRHEYTEDYISLTKDFYLNFN